MPDPVEVQPEIFDLAAHLDEPTASRCSSVGNIAGIDTDDAERAILPDMRTRRARDDANGDMVPELRLHDLDAADAVIQDVLV
jgi:hypothetical protein